MNDNGECCEIIENSGKIKVKLNGNSTYEITESKLYFRLGRNVCVKSKFDGDLNWKNRDGEFHWKKTNVVKNF